MDVQNTAHTETIDLVKKDELEDEETTHPMAAYTQEIGKDLNCAKGRAKDRFENSLMGFLILYFRETPGPHPLSRLEAKIGPVLPTLRRTDGSQYLNNPSKAIIGCLSSSGVFFQSDAGWNLNAENAETYERRILMNLKRKQRNQDNKTEHGVKRLKHKRAIRALSFGERISKYMKTAFPETLGELTDPMRKVRGNENLDVLKEKLGEDRFQGLLQGYNTFSTYFAEMYPKVMMKRKNKSYSKLASKAFESLASLVNELEK